MSTEQITVCEGKYTVIYDEGHLSALRYGTPWRDLVGDNLVYWMMVRIQELEKEVKDAKRFNPGPDRRGPSEYGPFGYVRDGEHFRPTPAEEAHTPFHALDLAGGHVAVDPWQAAPRTKWTGQVADQESSSWEGDLAWNLVDLGALFVTLVWIAARFALLLGSAGLAYGAIVVASWGSPVEVHGVLLPLKAMATTAFILSALAAWLLFGGARLLFRLWQDIAEVCRG